MMKTFYMLLLVFVNVFAALKYCDIGAGSGGDGTISTPWNTPDSGQATAANLAAGDTLLIKWGTLTMAAPHAFGTNSGSTTAGYITYMACRHDWSFGPDTIVQNGDTTYEFDSMFVYDANGAAASCVNAFTAAQIRFQNIRFTGATSHNVDVSSGGDYLCFINCVSDSSGGSGFNDNNGSSNATYINVLTKDNAGDGFTSPGSGARFIYTVATGNGDMGLDVGYQDAFLFYGCLFYDNGNSTYNLEIDGYNTIINCVIDGTNQTGETGILFINSNTSTMNLIIGTSVTNCATGVNMTSNATSMFSGVYFGANTADTANTAKMIESPNMPNLFGAGSDGYVDAANADYNSSATAPYRRKPIIKLRTTIP